MTRIHSITGRLEDGELIRRRPFRAPHHSITTAGLVGGARRGWVGEVVLAHRGVLFLDELSEFARPTLEALRQPLEDGRVAIVRARHSAVYPARFALVAATNPCPCGYLGDGERCRCARSRPRPPPPAPQRAAARPHRPRRPPASAPAARPGAGGPSGRGPAGRGAARADGRGRPGGEAAQAPRPRELREGPRAGRARPRAPGWRACARRA